MAIRLDFLVLGFGKPSKAQNFKMLNWALKEIEIFFYVDPSWESKWGSYFFIFYFLFFITKDVLAMWGRIISTDPGGAE